jgi:hypothetical protein
MSAPSTDMKYEFNFQKKLEWGNWNKVTNIWLAIERCDGSINFDDNGAAQPLLVS